MKKALIIKIRIYQVDQLDREKLVEEKIRYKCPYCKSGWIYQIKNKKQIYCRKCGEISRVY